MISYNESTLKFLIRHYEILSAQNGAEPEQYLTLQALLELRNLREEIEAGELHR